MLTKTPFLNGFSSLLCGRAKRSNQEVLIAEAEKLEALAPDALAAQFSEELPAELLAKHAAPGRNRVYPALVTFWGFFGQVLAGDGSCARVVARVQAWMSGLGRPVPSAANSSYVEARKALPAEMLRAANGHLLAALDAGLPESGKWRGLRVLAEDGTSAQMPDTAANQLAYPQPAGQAEGCGFPVIGLVGLVDLGHGGLVDLSGSTSETGELRGHDELEGYLGGGDVLVGDRLYSSYEVVARLGARGCEFVGRNHQSRKIDFRKGRRIGPDERLVTWTKPPYQPPLSRLSPEGWEALPGEVEMRVIRIHGPDREGRRTTRYIVTTLLDPAAHPANEVASIYLHRWEIEVRFRDIKTTMGMEMLRTKTPAMVRKEILMHLVVYNALRLLMLKAGQACGESHRRISFKGAIQVIEECRAAFERTGGKPRARAREKGRLLRRIAERIVPLRPGRNEPRRAKRRPKCSRWLQRPRHSYFEHFRSDDPPLRILDQPA